jgi:pantoate--beta-alanine ligase
VRDADGLAFSSRNVRLSEEGRARALALSRAIIGVAEVPDSAEAHRRTLRETLSGVEVIYADVVDPTTFRPSSDADSGEARALVAAVVDGVRLIDNGPVLLKGEE